MLKCPGQGRPGLRSPDFFLNFYFYRCHCEGGTTEAISIITKEIATLTLAMTIVYKDFFENTRALKFGKVEVIREIFSLFIDKIS